MAKKNQGKTETIKERTVYIYMPSFEMLDDWKKRSRAAHISLSRFVLDRVEDSIRKEEGEEGYVSRIQLIERLKKEEDELKDMIKENRLLKKLAENQESELKRFRAEPFLSVNFEGTRKYDTDLIQLLKRGESYSADEILSRMGIERSNVDLIKAINRQLEVLEGYGLVTYSGRGWRWKA